MRTVVATSASALFGTRVSRFRMKCVRQRCHEAPPKTVAIAARSPWWASEVTSSTPESPRATRPRRNESQNAPSSLVPTSMPSTSRFPSALTAVATTPPAYAGVPRRADLGDAALLAHALGERVEPEVAVGAAVERPLEEGAHDCVELRAEA